MENALGDPEPPTFGFVPNALELSGPELHGFRSTNLRNSKHVQLVYMHNQLRLQMYQYFANTWTALLPEYLK